MDSPIPSVLPTKSAGSTPIKRANDVPFDQLPNLPKPIVPEIALNIQRMGLAAMLQVKPSLASFHKVGYSVEDRCTQTEQSDVIDLKYTIGVLQTLVQDTGQLRRDLNFAQHILKANYERQINDHSTELYCRINKRLNEIERKHKLQMTTVRKSYQTQLDDAIQKIAGEYKAYYDELLQGKTGRHDLIIKELKEQVLEKDLLLRQQEVKIEDLESKLQELEQTDNDNEPAPPPPPPGITLEEAKQLQDQIDQLENELDIVRSDLAMQEDENKKLMRQVDHLNQQIEDQKGKYNQLQKDMDSYKKKMKQEQEKAAKMAESQLAALEKEMKEKMEKAEKEAAQKAQEQAEMQRMRDQAKFQEEIEKRKSMEDQLRSQMQEKPDVVGDQDLLNQVERLQKIEQQQKLEILRLGRELERTNKVWELKMAVMKKNYHALKDEFYIRHSLQRQAAQLHHSTVAYAISGNITNDTQIHSKPSPRLVRLPQTHSPGRVRSPTHLKPSRDSSSSPPTESVSPIPQSSPSPSSKTVHFKEVSDHLHIRRPYSKPENIPA